MAKKKAAAHHGGAWKVAYADFVTAMMALFMVLWISAQDKKILIATSRYFQSPFHSPMEDHSGVMPFNKPDTSQSKSDDEIPKPNNTEKPVDISFLNSVAADFYRLVHIDQDLQKKPIDIEITSDGLRITLFDRGSQPLFTENGATFTPWGKFVMQNLAWLIDRHNFRVTIDGHTRSELKLPQPDYGSWELSSDRANAARRSLVYYAVEPKMIERVSGYADTRPLMGEKPNSESNQRITLSLSLSSRPHAEPAGLPVQQPAAPAAGAGAPLASLGQPPFDPMSMRPFLQGRKSLGEGLQAPAVKSVLPLTGVTAPVHPACGPNVEVVKEGEKVVRIIVTCACGERTEVECIYRAGA